RPDPPAAPLRSLLDRRAPLDRDRLSPGPPGGGDRGPAADRAPPASLRPPSGRSRGLPAPAEPEQRDERARVGDPAPAHHPVGPGERRGPHPDVPLAVGSLPG